MKLKLKGTEADATTTSGAASNVGSATLVRVTNSGSTARLVTLEEAGGTDIGTFTLSGGATEYVDKAPTDKIFAAHADIKLVSVAFYS
jgi:hypothetical protein